MPHVLDQALVSDLVRRLSSRESTTTPRPGERSLHVLYGGAHLFKSDAMTKLTGVVTRMWSELVPDPTALARVFDLERGELARVHAHVTRGLAQAVHDLRVSISKTASVRAVTTTRTKRLSLLGRPSSRAHARERSLLAWAFARRRSRVRRSRARSERSISSSRR
jgi:hypothetical protein